MASWPSALSTRDSTQVDSFLVSHFIIFQTVYNLGSFFFFSPEDPSRVGSIRLGVNETSEDGEVISDTGRTETIECGLVLKSIGYKSVQVRACP